MKDKLEHWIISKIDNIEKSLKAKTKDIHAPPGGEPTYHMVMPLVLQFGRDILLEVLKVYRKHKKGEDISED